MFTSRSDGQAFPEVAERLLNFPCRFANQILGWMKRHFLVVDFEANPCIAGTGDEQPIPTRFAQVVADVATDVGVDVAFGEG